MLKKPAILLGSLLLAAIFVFGLVRLFELRYDQGDIYPPYSTLRADPLGASVFYESLEQLEDLKVERYFEATLKEDQGQGRTLFVLGLRPFQLSVMPRDEFRTLQQFVFSGGRVVLSYVPVPKQSGTADPEKAELNEEKKRAEAKSGPPPEERRRKFGRHPGKDGSDDKEENDWRQEYHLADVAEEWGFKTAFRGDSTNETTEARSRFGPRKETSTAGSDTESDGPKEIEAITIRRVVANSDLPPELAVHTALYFARVTNEWTTIYADGKFPVMLERHFGKGSVVLVADSYPLSNEALHDAREPQLLAWLLGGGRTAIFDEAHLGVVTEPGVATLMRRYRLHGLMLSLVVLALLFIWKNSVSLVPPYVNPETAGGPVVTGRDSAAGYVNLLRRSIAPADLFNTCLAEWQKTGGSRLGLSATQQEAITRVVQEESLKPARERNPVAAYRAISEILQHRR
ncbi:MAG TPA: DUF4350 domain-containing protein [Dongiaceae bacterium]|nr:DUF4350 domain-containing protein [Dongiaceae bacterium]